ncbi:MAG: helicase-associated domain-containing protein [Candidatus Bathyarchaeota archaeon]|nr:helicase-associated domain-containing protein [Candidatus Termiticorpusculum sp.]MCL1970325.1 helicase-associated domain-containing protein [Candidatus Termiticorpusculum sp.]
MIDVIKLAEYLNTCSNSTPYGFVDGVGLTELHKRIFKNKVPVSKIEMVRNLAIFYANEQNIINIWNGLSECEKDFIRYIVQSGGEHLPTTILYAKKHNLKTEYISPNGFKKSITSPSDLMHLKFLHVLTWNIPDTKTVMFFPGGNIPLDVLKVLKRLVGPIKFEYEEYTPVKTDYIICRENRISDFATLVKLAISERLKARSSTVSLTPVKLARLSELIGFEEVCDKDGKFCTPKEAKRSKDFKVAHPLFVLAVNSGLLNIDREGVVCPGKDVSNLLSIASNVLAKQLFRAYINENDIQEIQYATHITVSGFYWQVEWHRCRKIVVDLLKKYPVEKFLKYEDFDNHVKMFHGDFLRRTRYCRVSIRGYSFSDYYDSINYEPDWDECESQIIRAILSFLSAMGLVDIAYTENVARIKYANDDYCVGIAGFRITNLGAWVFGITDKYQTAKIVSTLNDQGQLIVLPDYSVIISGLKCRIEHETFFSKFLTKVSVDGNAAVYKLDFQSILRAHDDNITPQKIKKALQKASDKPLPDNVIRSLDDWQLKIGRVKIHTLTILETDDILLLEEIKHIKGFDSIITNDLHTAVAINDEKLKRAKMLIERNGWPVKI